MDTAAFNDFFSEPIVLSGITCPGSEMPCTIALRITAGEIGHADPRRPERTVNPPDSACRNYAYPDPDPKAKPYLLKFLRDESSALRIKALQLLARERQLFALKSVCTHLGCTPNWLEAEQKFKCPCHGSGFYKDGINFEGPAPRPLERYIIGIADDGQVEIDKSRIFQEEMGQWSDPSSFVPV